jgi:hypothetical protein
MIDNGYLLCFRWLELLADPRKDFGQIRPAVLSNHHRHLQIWPRSWPDKQNSSTSLCRLRWATSISNPEAEMNPYRPVIKTSSVPSLHYSIRQTSLDVDAWLHTIESKFALLPAPCSDVNKALFAAQQLRGTARLWWDHFHAM